jgi:hypothetical protein
MTTLRVGEKYLIEYGYGLEEVEIIRLWDNGAVHFHYSLGVAMMHAERFVLRIRSAEPKEVQELTV